MDGFDSVMGLNGSPGLLTLAAGLWLNLSASFKGGVSWNWFSEAINRPAFCSHVGQILLLCPDPKVVRVHAIAIVARMTDAHSFRDWTAMKLPRYTRCDKALSKVVYFGARRIDICSPSNKCAGPYPAAGVRLRNIGQGETLGEGQI